MKKENTIASDPKNGSFREQFVWCKKNKVQTFPGSFHEVISLRTGKIIKLPAFGCGKFGGDCSSKTCREGHLALA